MTISVTEPYRQAIQTKWLGPTNFKGSRVVASCEAGRLVMPWDHALNPSQNHAKAARLLCEKLEWDGQLIGGGLPGSGYAFVFSCDA